MPGRRGALRHEPQDRRDPHGARPGDAPAVARRGGDRAPRALGPRVRAVVPGQRSRRSRTTGSVRQLSESADGAPGRSPRARSRSRRRRRAPCGAAGWRWGRAAVRGARARSARSAPSSRSRARLARPRTITFHTKYQGAPAALGVDRLRRARRRQAGAPPRRAGPEELLLEYDERLEVLQLLDGDAEVRRPADRDAVPAGGEQQGQRRLRRRDARTTSRLHAALLDTASASRASRCAGSRSRTTLTLLCDHARSVLKGQIRQEARDRGVLRAVRRARPRRDPRPRRGTGRRRQARPPGDAVPENGMRVTDVEVPRGADRRRRDRRAPAPRSARRCSRTSRSCAPAAASRSPQQEEVIARSEADARAGTAHRRAELEVEATADRLRVALAACARRARAGRGAAGNRGRPQRGHRRRSRRRARPPPRRRRARDRDPRRRSRRSPSRRCAPRSTPRWPGSAAAQGGFSEALLALSNHEVLAKVAEAMSVQSFIGGKSLADDDRSSVRRHAARDAWRIALKAHTAGAGTNGESRALPG